MNNKIENESTRDKIEVMTAYLLRKPIEVQIHYQEEMFGNDEWYDVIREPSWNWDKAIWRIKDE